VPDGTIYDVDGNGHDEMYPSLSEALGEEITPQTAVDRLWRSPIARYGDSARSW